MRTLSQETHVIIRHLEESYEELNADDNSTDGEEDDNEICEENRERMQIIANNCKYHGLNNNEQQMNSEKLQQKACNNN